MKLQLVVENLDIAWYVCTTCFDRMPSLCYVADLSKYSFHRECFIVKCIIIKTFTDSSC